MLLNRLRRRSQMPALSLFLFTSLFSLLGLSACTPGGDNSANGTPVKPKDAVEVQFAYSSEKKPWIEPLAARFNNEHHTVPGTNKPIFVNAFVVDSGTARSQIVAKTLQVAVWSPSNSLWKSVLNFEADAEIAGSGTGDADPLLLTPVVLGMWKPMAQALGWPGKSLGLKDILDLNANPDGWGSVGHPEWGHFKYAHTNPEVSSTGLSTVAAEFYAGAGKTTGLTEEDVNDPKVRDFVKSIEQTIVHYSSTTTIFKENVRKGGMDYISAVALEEQTVLELNRTGMPVPMVAIYPREGTFWHDNPYIILKAPWVTDEQRSAATQFKDYLLQPTSQQAALQLGFRPANTQVSWRTEPFTTANGVDPEQPKTTLQVPAPRVLESVKNAWSILRKQANIMIVLDVSPSMDDQNKLPSALAGIKTFLAQTRDVDRVGFVVFDKDTHLLVPIDTLSNTRAKILDYLNSPDSLPRSDSTAIYDGVAAGLDELTRLNDHDHINALVVLTDGEDNASSTTNRQDVPSRLRLNRNELWAVKLFPIAYGSGQGVDTGLLQSFADETQTHLVSGDATDIKRIYEDMSNYF
ncbi:MAG: substrate-binding and VWA domain-containing protein [Chloroflexota bacterium]|nr:substrate-binding and VWA domain-containing protein [Chloroflexota bacterium]